MTEDTKKIDDLTRSWQYAKDQVEVAKELLLSVEYEIWSTVGAAVPEKGTTNFDSGLKIETGFAEKWDQEMLAEICSHWGEHTQGYLWPFKTEYKKDGKRLELLKEMDPAAYNAVMLALTMQKKKPAFSVKG